MAQHDMNIANQGFPAFRSDLNSALSAIISNSSGATEPSTTVAYQFWADTTNDLLKQRNAANDGWVSILTLSTGEPVTGGTQDKIEEGNSSIEVVDSGTGYAMIIIDGVERARFISGGNFGVGVSDPDEKLEVDGWIKAKNGANFAGGFMMPYGASGDSRTWGIRNDVNAYGDLAIIQSDSQTGDITTGGAQVNRLIITPSGDLQFNSGYGSVATAYGCRAWVNFNGTGTVAIRDSGNVSSITDNGTGQYYVNFSNSMTDTNYAATGNIQRISGDQAGVLMSEPDTTSRVKIELYLENVSTGGSRYYDNAYTQVAIFR